MPDPFPGLRTLARCLPGLQWISCFLAAEQIFGVDLGPSVRLSVLKPKYLTNWVSIDIYSATRLAVIERLTPLVQKRNFLEIISDLPDLQTLQNMEFLAKDNDEWNDRVIALLLQACPKLRRIDCWWGDMKHEGYVRITNAGYGVVTWKFTKEDDPTWI